jgi:hypothetical protein
MAGLTHIWTTLPTSSETLMQEDIKTTVEELEALKARQIFLQRKLESLLRAGEISAQKRRDEAEALFLEAEMELEKMAEEHKDIRRSAGIDHNTTSRWSSGTEEDAPVIVEAPHSLDSRSLSKFERSSGSHLADDSLYINVVKWATQELGAMHVTPSNIIAVPCEPMPEPSPGITEKPDSLVTSRKKAKKHKKMTHVFVEEPVSEDQYADAPMSSSNAESGSQNISFRQPVSY